MLLIGIQFFLGKNLGGLGVKRITKFNISLLGKWCWRMVVERVGLWYRVLPSSYGVERVILKQVGLMDRCAGGSWCVSVTVWI